MKVKLKGVQISHLAVGLPKEIISVTQYEKLFSEKDIKRIKDSTGVESMHVAAKDKCSSDYFVETGKKLMAESGLQGKDFDGVVLVFQTPDYIAPPTCTIVQDRLGLPQDSVAFDINYGCTGYIYGLYQAALLVTSGSCKRVLMFVGDTQICTLNEEDRANRMILGDGFAATVIEQGNDEMCFQIHSDGSGYRLLITEAGGFRMPKSEETKKPYVDENGYTHWPEQTHMDGMGVMNFALKRVPPLVKDSLEYAGWTVDSTDAFVFHQANQLILQFLQRRLKIPNEKMTLGLKTVGNTAGASIPIALSLKYQETNGNYPLEKILFCGFGIGLSWGTATANLSKTKIYEPWEF